MHIYLSIYTYIHHSWGAKEGLDRGAILLLYELGECHECVGALLMRLFRSREGITR